MGKSRNLFTVFPRKLKNGNVIYYYYVYDASGKRKHYSTGKATEKEAYQFCIELAKRNTLNRKSSLAFNRYCENWFVYDKCPYIQKKLLHGFGYSRTNAENERGQLVRHAMPFFKDKSMENITERDIENFIAELKRKGLSNTSVNNNLKLLGIIFGRAEKENVIQFNPMRSVMRLKSDTAEKGFLTEDEADRIFMRDDSLEKIWLGDMNGYLLNYTAYSTGCRLGELQALCREDIFDGYILVRHSLDRKYGVKSTKTGKVRAVPLDKRLETLLQFHVNRRFGQFVFGADDGMRPIRHDEVYPVFFEALGRAGISRDEMRSRNITWHSYRHGFTTRLLSSGVSETLVRAMTGHSTRQMVEHYTHVGIEELKKAVNV